MPAFGWPELLALLTSVGFGVLSAIFPIVNAEAYVIASQVSAVAGPIPIAIGLAIGQTIGKCLLFLAVREGKDSRFIQHRRAEHRDEPVGRFRSLVPGGAGHVAGAGRAEALGAADRADLPRSSGCLRCTPSPCWPGRPRCALPWFAAVVLLGRSVRFVLVALGVGHLDLW